MTTNRLVMIGLGVACVVVLVLGWFLGVKPQFDSATASDASTAEVQSENLAHQADLANMKKEFGNLATLTAKLATLKESLPSTIDAPGLIGSIGASAQLVGASVTSITIGDPTLYVPASSATPASTPSTGATDPSASPSPSPSVSGGATSTATTVPVNSDDSALVSTGNFYTIPVNISVTANLQQTLTFMYAMQSATRLFLLTKATVNATGTAGQGASTLTGLIYVLVDPATAAGATSGSGSTPTPTPSVSTTPTPTPTPTPTGAVTPTPTATTKP